MTSKEIEKKIRKLPQHLLTEVDQFVEKLLKKSAHSQMDKDIENFKFDWEGGLINLKEEFTSVKLQHKSLEWR